MIAIRTTTPAEIPQLVDLLTLLFILESDFDVDKDKQTRGLLQLLDS